MSYVNDDKKYSTYSELRTLIQTELDLLESDPAEEFITVNEMIGYYNDAILDARSEILNIYEDYFLSWAYLDVVQGTEEVRFPPNIWGNKIRAIQYNDGSIRYTITRIKNYNKFAKIQDANYLPNNDPWYNYWVKNDQPGRERIVLVPPPTFSTVDNLLPNSFTPVRCWFLRQCNRVPTLGEYAFRQKATSASTFAGSDQVTVDGDIWDQLQVGQGMKFAADQAAYLPAEIAAGTVYYIIKGSTRGFVKLASSKVNAIAGTFLTLSTPVTMNLVYFTFEANKNLIDNLVIDLPEFSNFIQAWVRCRILMKLKDSSITDAKLMLEQARKQMVDSLTQKEPDDDTVLEGDFSHYMDSSVYWPTNGGLY